MKKLTALFITFIILFSVTSCKKATDEFNIAASTKYSSELIHETETINSIKESNINLSEFSQSISLTKEENIETSKHLAQTTENTKTIEVKSEVLTTTYETEQTTFYSPSCTIRISCHLILGNEGMLKNSKEEFLPTNGVILETKKVEIYSNETVYDVLKRVCSENVCSDSCNYCKQNGIHIESSYTPGYDNYYIEGIHQIYEKDCGSKSGWMYRVNGVFPNTGCSSYYVNDGDVIEWIYTLDLGEDLGESYG